VLSWASELWGTKTSTEYLHFDVTAGTSATEKCGDCKQSDQQQHGLSAAAGSVLYTLRDHDGIAKHGVFLHGYDTASKKTSVKVDLPFSLFGGSFAEGAWAVAAKPDSSLVFALGPTGKKKPGPLEHSLFQIDTASQKATLVTKTTSNPANANSGTYDSKRGIFYWVYQGTLASQAVKGISTVTGNVTCDVDTEIYTIDYDSVTDSLVGLGFASTSQGQFRQLATLDLASGEMKTILNISDHASNLPATAFDAASGTFVCMLVPQGAESADLVAIDVRGSGGGGPKVLSSPQLCAVYDECPWTLGWIQ
jgi:hypothetical protein